VADLEMKQPSDFKDLPKQYGYSDKKIKELIYL
jgi:hypothetical protein